MQAAAWRLEGPSNLARLSVLAGDAVSVLRSILPLLDRARDNGGAAGAAWWARRVRSAAGAARQARRDGQEAAGASLRVWRRELWYYCTTAETLYNLSALADPRETVS